MTLRPCLTCGEPSEGTRCPEHTVDTKPQAQIRGYDARWRALSKRARRLQPFCTDCGADNDLQLDHTPETWTRRAAGLPINLEHTGGVVCGPCNRDRGAARGDDPRRSPRTPARQAKLGSHTPGGYL